MYIRYPINLISRDIGAAIEHVSLLLGASDTSKVPPGAKLDDLYFVGPHRLANELCSTNRNESEYLFRTLVNVNLKQERQHPSKIVIASGAYLPPDFEGNLPFLMVYKRMDVLDGKPVLISENYLNRGELVVVPESSELFAVLFYNDGKQCKIPEEIEWYCWYSDENSETDPLETGQKYQINFDDQIAKGDSRIGNVVRLEAPLLELDGFSKPLLNVKEPVVQITPIISDEDSIELLSALEKSNAWIRRTGENNILYTQDTFDIWEHSLKSDSPPIFKKVVKQLQSEHVLKILSELSGMKLGSLNEIYAFHMRSNEFITKHADSSLGGKILVRFNWLLQSPTGRDFDLRFWKGQSLDAPITQYCAIPNSAVIFYLGEETPHDLTPIPEICDKDRYNMVISFARSEI